MLYLGGWISLLHDAVGTFLAYSLTYFITISFILTCALLFRIFTDFLRGSFLFFGRLIRLYAYSLSKPTLSSSCQSISCSILTAFRPVLFDCLCIAAFFSFMILSSSSNWNFSKLGILVLHATLNNKHGVLVPVLINLVFQN